MLASSIPTKISVPFAASGAKTTIPVASQIGITAGAASYTDGFPPLTRTPIAAGGVPPFGEDFNGILNAISLWQQWQGAGGTVVYDGTFSAAIGGYPKGAVLYSATVAGLLWVSTADNNTTNPDSPGTNWVAASTPSAALLPLIYQTAGATTEAVPIWATRLEWEGWGSGAGGGGGSAGGCGSGGGAGAYGRGVLTVTPGGSVTFTIAAAGIGGASAADGTNGGNTTITGTGITSPNTITLPGGGKGFGGSGAPQTTVGAASASPTVNTGDIGLIGSSGLAGYVVGANVAIPGGGWSFGGLIGGTVVSSGAVSGGNGLSFGCGGSAGGNGAGGGNGKIGAIIRRWRP